MLKLTRVKDAPHPTYTIGVFDGPGEPLANLGTIEQADHWENLGGGRSVRWRLTLAGEKQSTYFDSLAEFRYACGVAIAKAFRERFARAAKKS